LKNTITAICSVLAIALFMSVTFCSKARSGPLFATTNSQTTKLPEPKRESDVSVEEALSKRRSVRQFTKKQLSLSDISQLLWAAQGITSSEGFRTAPSAGALYPLELYLVVGNVADLTAGVYTYKPRTHELARISTGDKRTELCRAALGQSAIENASAIIVFTAVAERTTVKYRERGIRYLHIEVGHAAQNVSLQSVSLAIGTVPIGAFDDRAVAKVIGCRADQLPLYLMPIGTIS
jgi:SagB-type dehydrogenase family enzyme